MLSLTFAPVTESGYVNIYELDITEHKKAEKELKTPFSYAGKGARHINKKVRHTSGKIKSKLNKTFKKKPTSG